MKSAKGLFAAVLIMAAIGVTKAQIPYHSPTAVKVPFESAVGLTTAAFKRRIG
jgi:hypothetical protein